jgi:hypothetical protein
MKPNQILDSLIEKREHNKLTNTLSIDIIKNIKRSIGLKKLPFYESELSSGKYNYYKDMIENK